MSKGKLGSIVYAVWTQRPRKSSRGESVASVMVHGMEKRLELSSKACKGDDVPRMLSSTTPSSSGEPHLAVPQGWHLVA